MTAPLSVCLISRNDPHLETTLLSLRDFVQEIVIVCNDSADTATREVALRLGAKFEVDTSGNDDQGRIIDFSKLRNRSLDLATQPWQMWLDSDDLLIGAERLEPLLRSAPPNAYFLFPYEYAFNDQGVCTVRQYRERVWPKGAMRFSNPVHEVATSSQPMSAITTDDIVLQHQRGRYQKVIEPERNLRILEGHCKQHPEDVRSEFYLGLEQCNMGQYQEGIATLENYLSRSGWSDERAMALYKLVDMAELNRDFQRGLDWAYDCLKETDWLESYFQVGRMYFRLERWERAIHYLEQALLRPDTKTLLFVNQAVRSDIHRYLTVCHYNLRRPQEALEHCLPAVEGFPQDQDLKKIQGHLERLLGKSKELPEKPLDPKRMEIVFVGGPSLENWDPVSVETTGIGGSETMLIAQARNLAKLGHRVVVYAAPKTPGTFEGVEYRHLEDFRDIACDVLIVSRFAPFLGDEFNVKAKARFLWLHDVCAIQATNELLLKADRIICLSQWHKRNVVGVHNLHPDQVIVSRNGIDLDAFKWIHEPRNRFRVVNSSSPDRSWDTLLDCWGRIRERVPMAELHLYYGFENLKKEPTRKDYVEAIQKRITNTPGVIYHGRIPQKELKEEFQRSGVWLYPVNSDFFETSCLSAMQAQEAGLAIITGNHGALPETIQDDYRKSNFVRLIDGDSSSQAYKDRVVETTIEAFNLSTNSTIPDFRGRFDLESLAKEWEEMFLAVIEEKKSSPLLPYRPTPKYQRRKSDLIKLNIACGPNVFAHDGWQNIDRFDFRSYFDFVANPMVSLHGMPNHQRVLATFLREGGDFTFAQHDMTQPFAQFADNCADFIYVGQAIEHLSPQHQTPSFLKECHRMLKPGGVIRLTTPNLDLLLDAYKQNQMARFTDDQPEFYKTACSSMQLALLMYGSGGENCTQDHYEGHMCLYTPDSIQKVLEGCGFREVSFHSPREGTKPEIAREIEECGMTHSMIVEALK